jgi:hypothetical protein
MRHQLHEQFIHYLKEWQQNELSYMILSVKLIDHGISEEIVIHLFYGKKILPHE